MQDVVLKFKSEEEEEDLHESLEDSESEEIFPQQLCEEDQNLALQSDSRFKPNVPYKLGTIESLIASYSEEADKYVTLISPNLFNKMKRTSRSHEHKTAFSQIRADKIYFCGIVHIPHNLSDGHFVSFQIDTSQRFGFHLSKKILPS